MTVCAAWLICYYIIKSVFILIRLIMNGTIRVLDSGMCTGGTALIAHLGFPPCFFLEEGVAGSGERGSGLIHIIIKKSIHPSAVFTLYLWCRKGTSILLCLLFFLKNLECSSATKKTKKN